MIEAIREAYYLEKVNLDVAAKVATSGVALLSLLPKNLDFTKDIASFSFYDQSWFYSSGTVLTESLCLAYPRIRGQLYGLKLRCLPKPHFPGPDYIESEVLSRNIFHGIGNIILSGSNSLIAN